MMQPTKKQSPHKPENVGNKLPALFALALLLLAPARADMPVEPPRAGEAPEAVLLSFNRAAQEEVARAVAALGHEKSPVRRAARDTLRNSPALTRAHLAAALTSEDPEVSEEARELSLSVCRVNEARLASALGFLTGDDAAVPVARIVEAAPACAHDPALRGKWAWAFLSRCTPDHAAILETLSADPNPWLRLTALKGALKTGAPSAAEWLRKATADPDESVRLFAVTERLYQGDPAALQPAVDLLSSSAPETQRLAHLALVRATRQDIPFPRADDLAARRDFLARWNRWVGEHGGAWKPAAELREGVVLLRDETDLAAWISRTEDTRDQWSLREGVLSCAGGQNGVLICPVPLRNYHLSYEWRWPAGQGDSGLFLGIEDPGKDALSALEVQMLKQREGDFWSIGSFTRADGEAVPNHSRRLKDPGPSPDGEWNAMEIKVSRGSLEVWVNGVKVNEFDGLPDRPTYFGLQMEQSPFQLRRLRVQPLP